MASPPDPSPPDGRGRPGGGPYRDERESLLGEIEGLREKLRGRRRLRLGLILGGLALHLALRLLLGGWLNGPDDGRFWAALLLTVAPLLSSLLLIAVAAVGKRG